jgi:hypothetical protein
MNLPELHMIKSNINIKLKSKDNFAIIRKILGLKIPNSKNNPLQPSVEQVNELKKHVQTSTFFQSLTPYKWSQILENFKDLLFINKSKISDQEDRANILVQQIMTNPEIKKIVIMDGHGRFLLTLLKKLGLRANHLKITVVDINPVVVDWHKCFFPKKIESIYDNIFNYEPSNTQLVYMNFCGLGGLKGQMDLANYLAKIKNSDIVTDTDTNLNTKNLFISFSIERKAKNLKKGLSRPIHERADKWLLLDTYPENTWLSGLTKPYVAKKLLDGPKNNFPTFVLNF